jgi:nicotinate-nucleotide adenylyltransferase
LIALFGGTFDPVHIGHVAAAQAALRLLPVAQVSFIVAAQPYHKMVDGQQVTGANHRLAMVEHACSANPQLVADGSELGRTGASYTVELLERRRRGDPRERRVWIIGSDAFADVLSWYRWRDVFALTNFLVFERQGFSAGYPKALERWIAPRVRDRVDGRRHGQVLLSQERLPEVSSTALRRSLAAGEPCEHLLPCGVYTYIKEQNLYTGRPVAP